MRKYKLEIQALFTQTELFALRQFYAGVPARQIRRELIDPWYVVYKHRHLPKSLYEAVKWELIGLPDGPPTVLRRSDFNLNHPRWRKCPYCEQWTESSDWRQGRWGDQMIGYSKSGCRSCYGHKVSAYKARMHPSQVDTSPGK